MAKISLTLLRSEQTAWKFMDNSLKDANGKSIHFGKYMNDKYKMNDEKLGNEPNESMAILMLLKSHVQEIK